MGDLEGSVFSVKGAGHSGPHVMRFHICAMPRSDKSRDRLQISGCQGLQDEGEKGPVTRIMRMF